MNRVAGACALLWLGGYVTGTHGSVRHMGNAPVRGVSAFSTTFGSTGPRDRKRRSLRERLTDPGTMAILDETKAGWR